MFVEKRSKIWTITDMYNFVFSTVTFYIQTGFVSTLQQKRHKRRGLVTLGGHCGGPKVNTVI